MLLLLTNRLIGESISVAEPVEAPDIDRVINSIRALRQAQ